MTNASVPILRLFRAVTVLSSIALASPAIGQPPGEVDLSFDPGSSLNNSVMAVVQQPDGKWIVAGRFTKEEGGTAGGVARFNTDGSLDSTFMAGPNWAVYAVAIQDDGKVIIGGGFDAVNGEPKQYLARLNNDGALDPTFDGGTTGPHGVVYAVALQSDGRIIIGGSFLTVSLASDWPGCTPLSVSFRRRSEPPLGLWWPSHRHPGRRPDSCRRGRRRHTL